MTTDKILMACANAWATASHSKRSKVGAVLALDGRIVGTGYNGTPPGYNNCCEDSNGTTLPEVVHAEENVILFCARHGLKTGGTTLYTTLSPCPSCSKMIAAAGIVTLVYEQEYRNLDGIALLLKMGVSVRKLA